MAREKTVTVGFLAVIYFGKVLRTGKLSSLITDIHHCVNPPFYGLALLLRARLCL
jgi:hypothetical protein